MKREKIQNEYMFDTRVENIFINEYMISAPGNFVKVYLVALMYADLDKEIDDVTLAKNVGLELDEVQRAWQYWQNLGVVRKEKNKIIFVELKEGLYGKAKEKKSGAEVQIKDVSHMLDNDALKKMFKDIEKSLARPLNGKETDEVLAMIDFGATPEIVSYAYSYCVAIKKYHVKYVSKVVQNWLEKGIETTAQAEKFLEEIDQRHYVYKRIMKALGFFRNATEEERRIIDRWLDDLNFSMDMILEACNKTSGISNPNINYVNSVLINRNKEKTGKDETGQVTRKHIKEYYDYIREKAENEAKERVVEVLDKIPEIAIIEERIKQNYISITKLAVSGGVDKQEKLAHLRATNENLQKQIISMLLRNGYGADYMDVKYQCPLCKDTGVLEDGKQCKCYIQRAEEASQWEK